MRFREFNEVTDAPINQTLGKLRDTVSSSVPPSVYNLFQKVATATKQGVDQIFQTYLSPGSKEGFVELPTTPRLGSRGVEAMNLQRGLMALGYDVGDTKDDGIIGPKTKAGILQFQKDNKLSPTGMPYKDTVAAVNVSLAAKPQLLGKLEKARPEEYRGKISRSHLGNKEARELLTREAVNNGIKGKELAAFLAQCSHETGGFRTLGEIWGPSRQQMTYQGRMGNVNPGDGYRYRGRGFIQLTGRNNYRAAGKDLGLPLEDKPEMVENPSIAAKTAVWYWKKYVSNQISNWDDVKAITRIVNGGYIGLDDRMARYAAFKQDMNIS